ncbi:GTP-binding protein [Candidatus Micrarchaeota archaeon CG10_big_fil_rev_8_21_14_0_10_45_29]|nr:MAG: GTP-binding protein [Candidatus Micrarchaeota archaeon CG10_big_fil_rev_8_21_14_0_10_45_29]
MGVADKLKELEEEMGRTQKNKATEFHIGILKSKIAKLKKELQAPKKSGKKTGGFDVKKSGDSTVVFIGLPSTGKSTLLNALTGAKSKIASYAFTTLTCIPGTMHYKGAQIQLLDLPGIIAGAKEGSGRGKEVLSVARNADLVLLVLDVFDPNYRPKLVEELEGIGMRLDTAPPKIFIQVTSRGGLNINYTTKQTHLNKRIITGVLNEYGIHNADVTIRQNATVDELIDVVVGNRKYATSLTVLTKTDLVKAEFLKNIEYGFVPVSAETGEGVDALREQIFKKLKLIRVFTKRKGELADDVPLMMREGETIADACPKLHRDLLMLFKYAFVWGPSAKFPGQKVGLSHVLQDGDTIQVFKK